ncbi:DUF1501 domain-containing protein [Calidifontimicrobium sp. SYSU G02091]|uniref:DUF1501 domain-containing protein n=1 Tax=Calidifontimicrobium sp. SYSU G02091 TaxID=2926421 RepID=UPI001F539B5C|nr:DUF1501 domain-containing protein [Calidifontimicrobium sp. SYSU G02091]MCI1193082.1 DUF1501 domain-containing protein [Calidifontimicrobium sp. SYSU G02091]
MNKVHVRTHDPSRRAFLRQAGALSMIAAPAAPLALNLAAIGQAAAQSASDYRALVCVFLFGGNDSFNMVLPTDTASWTAYTATRNQAPDPIALLAPGTAANASAAAGSPARLGGVLPIGPLNPQGRTFALHPLMGALRTMFDTDRRLAIVANVGPLIVPTTKAQYAQSTHPKPKRLFSHNDQQNTWMAFEPEGATRGWGGRIGDLLYASHNTNAVFTSVSASGNSVWLAGQQIQQYQVGSNGAIRLGTDANGRVFGSAVVGHALAQVAGSARGTHLFEIDMAAVAQRSMAAEAMLRTALKPASDPLFGTPPASGNYSASSDPKLQYPNPLSGTSSFNALAQQLQTVARMIDAGMAGAIGVRRQVFFVSMGGFDTHDQQNRNHADLMARLAHGLRYFDDTLGAMGARHNVTTFTATDFGRTFTSNGDGTDHGWGSHQFVMGGAVRGGDIYGRFPQIGVKNANNNRFDSSPDQLDNGSLLPEISVDQFAATLARWMGVSDADALTIFPNLGNFNPSVRNLGFMNT